MSRVEKALKIELKEGEQLPPNLHNKQYLEKLSIVRALRYEPYENPVNIEQICELKNLRELRLERLGLQECPKDIGLLPLKSLDLSDNPLERIPESVLTLQNLEHLTLLKTGLTEVTSLDGFKHLKTLDLSFNPSITQLPPLGGLVNLELLDLSLCGLRDLPNTLPPHLVKLLLMGCPIKEIPSQVFGLSALNGIDLSESDDGNWRYHPLYKNLDFPGVPLITVVPVDILKLENLKWLLLGEYGVKRIIEPPVEVASKGLNAIQEYWRQRQDSGTDYLSEAKLLIVGEPGSGKTSLAKKILDPNYRLPPGDTGETTRGIDVFSWSFPTTIRVRDGKVKHSLERNFRVNIWDFGGQQIYHDTHQFFLTHRSMYILLADSRKEDTDFEYWLNVVALLAGDSPLIIVKNEKQDVSREINEGALRGRFKNLKDTLATNLYTNRGFEDVVETVQRWLTSLPHIGTPLPKTWRVVRDVLNDDLRDYIDLDEYLDICTQNGFTKHSDKLQLSGYLHDLGIILHFQDDASLLNTVILNPRWGTDAVYRILDHPTVINSQGRFSRDELAEIWSEPKYCDKPLELLQIMIRFKLCYEVEEGVYLAPQRLGANQPEYSWDSSQNLHLRYEYDFMPKGIINRFIVGMHNYIKDGAPLWRDGVIVELDGTLAEVVEAYGQREISVRARGPEAKTLLSIINHEIDKIHVGFHKLQSHCFVPCNCSMCNIAEVPDFYPIEVIRRFTKKSESIQCRRSFEMVDSNSLLGNVFERDKFVESDEDFDDNGRRKESTKERSEDPASRRPAVFVSYTWGGESKDIVDQLVTAFDESNVTIIRDKTDMAYKESIRAFMQQLGCARAIVVIISKKYLQSDSCMFELTEIAKNRDFYDRVFPIVLEDAGLFKPIERVKYLSYWENRQAELSEAVKKIDLAKTKSIQEDIDLYDDIRGTIDTLMDILKNMNVFTPEQHRRDGFQRIISAIEAKE